MDNSRFDALPGLDAFVAEIPCEHNPESLEAFLAAVLGEHDPASVDAFVTAIRGEHDPTSVEAFVTAIRGEHNPASAAAFAAKILYEYSPDQPRDERGRWTTGDSHDDSLNATRYDVPADSAADLVRAQAPLSLRAWSFLRGEAAHENLPMGMLNELYSGQGLSPFPILRRDDPLASPEYQARQWYQWHSRLYLDQDTFDNLTQTGEGIGVDGKPLPVSSSWGVIYHEPGLFTRSLMLAWK
jgi:hypothetical protein